MKHVISFRRPEYPNTVSRLSVPPGENAAFYLRRLESLGYTIVDVVPPLDGPPAQRASGDAEILP